MASYYLKTWRHEVSKKYCWTPVFWWFPVTRNNIQLWLSSDDYNYDINSTRVQILDETDCISHSTNTLGKGMNPIILPPAMGK